MSTSFRILAVTNSNLSAEDFLFRIRKIAVSGVDGIILREKSLSAEEYAKVAQELLKICRKKKTECILHSHFELAKEYNCRSIHLPLPLFKEMHHSRCNINYFENIGISTHSVAEALEAEALGATYVTAGHIFPTDCKKGLPARGIEYLKQVVEAVDIPVYAIGGIDDRTIQAVKKAGAAGACVMSGIMTCKSPDEYVRKLKCIY